MHVALPRTGRRLNRRIAARRAWPRRDAFVVEPLEDRRMLSLVTTSTFFSGVQQSAPLAVTAELDLTANLSGTISGQPFVLTPNPQLHEVNLNPDVLNLPNRPTSLNNQAEIEFDGDSLAVTRITNFDFQWLSSAISATFDAISIQAIHGTASIQPVWNYFANIMSLSFSQSDQPENPATIDESGNFVIPGNLQSSVAVGATWLVPSVNIAVSYPALPFFGSGTLAGNVQISPQPNSLLRIELDGTAEFSFSVFQPLVEIGAIDGLGVNLVNNTISQDFSFAIQSAFHLESMVASVPALATNPANEGTLDFGNVLIGVAQNANLNISNDGSVGSQLSGMFPSTSGEFGPSSTLAFGPLGVNDEATRTYSYTPESRGSDNQTITVTSDGGSSNVTLQGTGVAPIQSTTKIDAPLTRITPLTPGSGSSNPPQITVHNLGDGNLSGLGAVSNLNGAIDAGTNAHFTGGDDTFSLLDGSSLDFGIHYRPTAHTVDTSTFTVNFSNGHASGNNAPSSAQVTVQGQGVGPIFAGLPYDVSNQPDPGTELNFGVVVLGDNRPLRLDLRNSTTDPNGGDASLTDMTLLSVEIVGADAADFSLESFFPGTVVGAGELLEFLVRFSPNGVPGVRSALLTIVTDVGAALGQVGESYSFLLTGESVPSLDPPGIQVIADPLVTRERGDSATFQIVLASQPTADVAIHFSSSDLTEGALDTSQIIFTPGNWNLPQTVTVHGVPDGISDGDQSYAILFVLVASEDPNYDGWQLSDLPATNFDGDFVWANPAGGIFSVGTNWESGIAPGPNDTAIFSLDDAYTVVFDADVANSRLLVQGGDVRFDLQGFTYAAMNPSAALPSVAIGVDDSDDARLRLAGGTLATQTIVVGLAGSGHLDVEQNTNIESTLVILGQQTGSVGSVVFASTTVSRWDIAHALLVGLDGSGVIELPDGGTITVPWMGMALEQSSSAFVSLQSFRSLIAVADIATPVVGTPGHLHLGGYDELQLGDLGSRTGGVGGLADLHVADFASVEVANYLHVWEQGTVDVSQLGLLSVGDSPGLAAALAFRIPGFSFVAAIRGVRFDLRSTTTIARAPDGSFGVLDTETFFHSGYVDYGFVDLPHETGNFFGEFSNVSTLPGNLSREGSRLRLELPFRGTGSGQISGASGSFAVEGVVVAYAQADVDPQNVAGRFTFTIDPDQTTIEMAGALGGMSLIEQLPGSLLTNLAGFFIVDLAPGVISFPGGGLIENIERPGPFLPGVPPLDGTIQIWSGARVEGAGTLMGDVINAGELGIGPERGDLHIIGNYTQDRYGRLDITLGGTDVGQFDQLHVSGDVTLNGELYLVERDGFVADVGNRFDPVLTYGNRFGDFLLIHGQDFIAGLTPRAEISPFSLAVVITAPAIIVNADALFTNESGGQAQFSVVLGAPPIADVVINLASSDSTEGIVTLTSLVFTSDNWSVPQFVTLTGQPDGIDDGDVPYFILFGPAISNDAAYGGMQLADLAVTNLDIDEQLFVTSPADGGTLDFGTVLVGQSNFGIWSVQSTGALTSIFGSFPAGAGDFSPFIDASFGPLSLGGIASREYTYTPSARGADLADFTITTNAGLSTVSFSGTGVAPVLSTTLIANPVARVGTTAAAAARIEIQNIGDGNLSGLGEVSNLHGSIDGGTHPQFNGGNDSFSLMDLALEQFLIDFTPTEQGASQSTFTLAFENGSADGTNAPQQIELVVQGLGIGPVFHALPYDPNHDPAPGNAFNFGHLETNMIADLRFDLFNDASTGYGGDHTLTDLTIVDYFFSGPDANDFELVGITSGTVIGAGESLSLLVRYHGADSAGSKAAALTLVTDVGTALGENGASFVFTIDAEVDQSDLPTVSIADASIVEGNAGTSALLFSVTLSHASSTSVQVAFETFPDSATEGSDFIATSGLIIFEPGQTQQLVSVSIRGDQLFEPNEEFTLWLHAVEGATFARAVAVGTIVADDGPPQLGTQPADDSTIDFGFVLVRNVGKVDIQVINLGTGGPLAGLFPAPNSEFSGTSGQNFSLAPGASSSRAYRYVPVDRGADSEIIVFVVGDDTSTLTLVGTGVAPVSFLSGGNAGFILVGATSEAILNVTNLGDGNRSGLGPTSNLRGSAPLNAGAFQLLNSSNINLTDGSTVPLHYGLTPTERGLLSSLLSLTFVNGSPDGTNQLHQRDAELLAQAVAPLLQTSHTDAGPVRVGTQSGSLARIDIRNTGDGNLSALGEQSNLRGAIDQGTVDSPFTGGGETFNLPDGAARAIPLTFAPTARGPAQSSFSIEFENGSADGTNQPAQVQLLVQGQGVGPVFAGTPHDANGAPDPGESLNFGEVLIGESRELTLEIGNITDDISENISSLLTDMTLLSIEIVGADAAGFTLSGFVPGSVLHAGQSLPLKVRFQANGDVGPQHAQLVITTDVGAALGEAGTTYIYDLLAETFRVVPSTISIADAAIQEGNSGVSFLEFVVSLSTASHEVVRVQFATEAGTAHAGADFNPTSGHLTFQPGEVEQRVRVEVIADQLFAADEWFVLQLSSPAGATINDARAVGTILNDDDLPQLLIDDASIDEGDSSARDLVFDVRLLSGSENPIQVDFTTTDGTAQHGTDYEQQSGRLTFASGETQQQFSVAIHGDTAYEPDETFRAHLSSAVGAAILRDEASGVIMNDDALLRGSVYVDLNYDGIHSTNDLGLVGVAIVLEGRSRAGTLLRRVTTTDADGYFHFTDLPQGAYLISESQPSGYGDGSEHYRGTRQVTIDANDRFAVVVLAGETSGLEFGELYAALPPQPPPPIPLPPLPLPPVPPTVVTLNTGSPFVLPPPRDPLDILINQTGARPPDSSLPMSVSYSEDDPGIVDRSVTEVVAVAVEDGRVSQLLFFAPIVETDVEPPTAGGHDGAISGRVLLEGGGAEIPPGEVPILAQVVVYLDKDGDGKFEPDEKMQPDLQGLYKFTDLEQRAYAMHVVPPEGWEVIDPDRQVELTEGQNQREDINFVQRAKILPVSAPAALAEVTPWWYLAVPIAAGMALVSGVARWILRRRTVANPYAPESWSAPAVGDEWPNE